MISTPGITGRDGKWPWKNGSLIETFLMPTRAFAGHHVDHPVDHEERIAVRDHRHHALDVDGQAGDRALVAVHAPKRLSLSSSGAAPRPAA
jgi:hypothetical protein